MDGLSLWMEMTDGLLLATASSYAWKAYFKDDQINS